MRIRKKKIHGKEYYYAQIDLRVGKGKRKSYSIYLGSKKPKDTKKAEKKIYEKIFGEFFINKKTKILDKKTVVKIELAKRKFNRRFKRLSKKEQENINATEIVDFVYTTLRTEGVQVSKQDVETAFGLMTKKIKRILMDEKIRISARMIQGVKEISKKNKIISLNFILNLHNMVMQGFEDKSPGNFRDRRVVILKATEKKPFGEEIKFKVPHHSKIKKLLKDMILWFEKNENKLTPVELAGLLHIKFYRIHPFKDGNKRICRLLFNKVLLDNGYPVLNISKNMEKYFGALIDSVEKNKDVIFVKFSASTFIEEYG